MWGDEMKIEKMNVRNEGYVYPKSGFYSAHDSLSFSSCYSFSVGVNKMIGEIDSGVWAVSYLLSMYRYRPEDFILFKQPEVTVNKSIISLDDLSQYSCYMDKLYPLFSTKEPVSELVLNGLRKSKLKNSPNDIRDLFHMDHERFERPLTGVGNEIFRAMAAIGYVYDKQIFCFPWLSKKRFGGYHGHMTDLLDILEGMGKVIILPMGA